MSKLSVIQRYHTRRVGMLIGFAYRHGYELTLGDAYRDPRVFGHHGEKKGYGSSKSVHKFRLAIDLNLWVVGKYIMSSAHPAWDILHDEWERLGGARRIKGDANHFSSDHNGLR